jgi:hypothetical protein
MARRCVFCHGEPVNQEHALPRWLARLFSDEIVDFERTLQLGNAEPEVRPWRGRPFSATVGGPCASCNNGWMSDLEVQAAPLLTPLIRNQDAQLDAGEQHVIATWAIKTMLMLRLIAADDDDRELDDDIYGWIQRTRSPPPAEQIWIASYAGEDQWPMSFHYFGAYIRPPGEADGFQPNAHCASFAVGHLAFGLAGHRLADGPAAVPSLPSAAVRPIWPAYGDAVEFPPPLALASDGELRSLATPGQWEGPAS